MHDSVLSYRTVNKLFYVIFNLFILLYLDLDAGGGSQPVSRIPGMDSTGISVTPSLAKNIKDRLYSMICRYIDEGEWYGDFPDCGPLAEDFATKLNRGQLNVCTVYVHCVQCKMYSFLKFLRVLLQKYCVHCISLYC